MNVWPGVASAVSRIRGPISTVSPSVIGVRSKETSSAAFTTYAAPVASARANPPVT